MSGRWLVYNLRDDQGQICGQSFVEEVNPNTGERIDSSGTTDFVEVISDAEFHRRRSHAERPAPGSQARSGLAHHDTTSNPYAYHNEGAESDDEYAASGAPIQPGLAHPGFQNQYGDNSESSHMNVSPDNLNDHPRHIQEFDDQYDPGNSDGNRSLIGTNDDDGGSAPPQSYEYPNDRLHYYSNPYPAQHQNVGCHDDYSAVPPNYDQLHSNAELVVYDDQSQQYIQQADGSYGYDPSYQGYAPTHQGEGNDPSYQGGDYDPSNAYTGGPASGAAPSTSYSGAFTNVDPYGDDQPYPPNQGDSPIDGYYR